LATDTAPHNEAEQMQSAYKPAEVEPRN